MIRPAAFAATLALAFQSHFAIALTLPTPSAIDPRLQTVPFTSDIVRVKVEIGRVTEIVLRPDETVKQYVFGDRDAWWYADKDNIVRIKPKGRSPESNVRIDTTRASYWFDLDSTAKGPVAYQLTIVYPPDPPPKTVIVPIQEEPERNQTTAMVFGQSNKSLQAVDTIPKLLDRPLDQVQGKPSEIKDVTYPVGNSSQQAIFSALNPNAKIERMGALPLRKQPPPPQIVFNDRYVVIGDESLDPVYVKDDGENTYIKFSSNQPLPSVFYVAADGAETRVNQNMQDDILVVHRVSERLIFRHGQEVLCLINLSFKPTVQSPRTNTISPEVLRQLK
jgi:type IV secretory pathway VirB9-like protein